MKEPGDKVAKRKHSKGKIYSVVDLETSGTNVAHGDRIIQVGIVLMQDGKIINQFATLVNPRRPIPHAVTQLTGISNNDVKKAPLFDDVAGTIYSLLTNTTFVAHNVNFDFPFLNAEFQRAGYPELRISAIDTVTLSQILLPTQKSFRLRDLTMTLKIEHDHPHSAISDAEATAKLLAILLGKLRKLPTQTVKRLAQLKLDLPRQTSSVFNNEEVYRRTHNQPLAENLYVSHGLVLRKMRPFKRNPNDHLGKYPVAKRAKQKLFGNKLEFRSAQSRMMNAIYNNYASSEPKALVVEAGTGIGKTLGYLLPLTYLAHGKRQIIVSTATNLLQQQIAQMAMQQLNAILPVKVNAVVVKGSDHYLDLAKYARSLSVIEDSKLVQLIKARLMVWLTQTTSGDLDELNLTRRTSPYFTEICHHGLHTLDKESPFYNDDFLTRRQKQLKSADIIITNHSYLAAHAQELGDGTKRPYLVVDEAQHLSESILHRSRQHFNFQAVHTTLNVLENLVNFTTDRNLNDVFADLALGSYNLELVRNDMSDLNNALDGLLQVLYREFMLDADDADSDGMVEVILDNDKLADVLDPRSDTMVRLGQALSSLQLHYNAIKRLFDTHHDRWLVSDRYLMNQFATQIGNCSRQIAILDQFYELLTERRNATVFWLTVRQSQERSTMELSGGLMVANHYLTTNVYPYFAQPLFVGATLMTSRRSDYLYNQLDLDRQSTRTHRFSSPFDYGANSRLYIAKDAPLPAARANRDYLHYMSQTIYQLTKETRCQTMILFNSLLTIEQVYSELRSTDLFDQRDILAQGVTGSREKLLKQFSTGKDAILLGAASFWEGIDLPHSQLTLLIITRLPFESPSAIMTSAQNELFKSQGQNPFYRLTLPRAITKLRQGVGRLLRTPDDYGVAVVLDPRLSTRRYGQTMQNALPKQMPIAAVPTKELVKQTKAFLTKRGKKAKKTTN